MSITPSEEFDVDSQSRNDKRYNDDRSSSRGRKKLDNFRERQLNKLISGRFKKSTSSSSSSSSSSGLGCLGEGFYSGVDITDKDLEGLTEYLD
jgi:hypothetical protein